MAMAFLLSVSIDTGVNGAFELSELASTSRFMLAEI